MKICPNCGRKLDESNFYKDSTSCDYLSVNCKKCINNYFKQFHTLNREGEPTWER